MLPLTIKEIPLKVTKLIEFEIEASNWCGALEVCIMSITHNQYLSEVVLKNVVEIMLNAHEDISSGYTISQVIDKCKLVLSLHFSTHCPCLHDNIREVYTNFLTSPMDKKEKTRSNRKDFGSEKGIVNFCFTRLEHELEPGSTDSALLDKNENTPEVLRQTIKGLFYQKEQFNIFEMLDRTERINRLMAVLHSIIELLLFDLAIWQSIGNSDMKKKPRGKKILMASVLQQNNNCFVTDICERILRLFVYFVHLEYPEEHIKTMTLWLNATMEHFYMNEMCSNKDYPSPGNVCKGVINELYDIINELPPKSILNILERIKPAYLRHQLSNHYSKTLLSISSDEQETFNILIAFLKEAKWNDFPSNENDFIKLKKIDVKRVKPNKLLKNLSMICNNSSINSSDNSVLYPKLYPTSDDSKIDQSFIICTLYITLQSCLEAYGIQSVQETLQKLNEKLLQAGSSQDINYNPLLECKSYSVTEAFLKKYRQIFEMLKEFILTLKQTETTNKPPEALNIFNNLLN
nr:uncharacterized protein LOC117982289 [Maniola hyperantus]